MKNCCTHYIAGIWNHCCCEHDKNYDKQIGRLKADYKFGACALFSPITYNYKYKILKYTLAPILVLLNIPNAFVMFIAVRLRGAKYYKKAGLI